MITVATTIARERRQAAKRQLIAQIEQGASVQQAKATIGIPMMNFKQLTWISVGADKSALGGCSLSRSKS
jgi:hypothetical protein